MENFIDEGGEGFHNWFLKITSLPTAEALIPVNPVRWPAYAVGSSYFDHASLMEKGLGRSIKNFRTSCDYLATAHNDSHYNTRFQTLTQDTFVVNSMCEIGGTPGAWLAGGFANNMANAYEDQIVKDDFDRPEETTFSCELRLRGGPGSK